MCRKTAKVEPFLVRDVARLWFSFLLLLTFASTKEKRRALLFEMDDNYFMVTNKTELKIRGLSEQEVDYLKAFARETKAKSFNEFLVTMCREKIEKGKFNLVESNYLAHLENMKLTSDHVLFLTQKQTDILSDFEKKMARYEDHISRWLEYEGEVESDD